MISLNRVEVGGYLGKDPELRRTADGTAVCSFSVGSTEKWKGKDCEMKEKTEWSNIVVWGKQAEHCEKYLKKGAPVLIEGKKSTRSYEVEGVKKWATDIIANRVHFLSVDRSTSSSGRQGDDAPPLSDDNAPPYIPGGVEDDLPF